MVVTKKQHKFGSATEESVLPPKTNDNGIGTMSFISVSPSLPLCIPSPPTRRAEKGHAGALQTFSLWRWGGNGLAVRQNQNSLSFKFAITESVVSSSGTFLGENREKTLIICGGRRGRATAAAAMTGGKAVAASHP